MNLKFQHIVHSLEKHLQIHHSEENSRYVQEKQENQAKRKKVESSSQPKITEIFGSSKIMDACVKLASECGRPFTLFDDPPMQQILKDACKNTKEVSSTISSRTVKTKLQQQASQLRNKIIEDVKNNLFHITTDMATCMMRSFIGKFTKILK